MIRYLVGIGLLFLIACQDHEPDPKLKEAFETHELALKFQDSLKTELADLAERTLSPEQQGLIDELAKKHEAWEDNLVEVPGFAHDHDHGHDHDHDHDHAEEEMMENLPPAEVLQIQQAMANEVKGMLADARALSLAIDEAEVAAEASEE